MQTLLVTGGAGFIGSAWIRSMLSKHKDWKIVNMDALTYAGNLKNLESVENHTNYTFIKGDIRNRSTVESLFHKYSFDAVIHFAAQSHVDRSIQSPELFVETNVLGTQVLLEAARKSWLPTKKAARFVYISTDEVYGPSLDGIPCDERAPLCPSSPYAASKAGGDLLAQSYYKTYDLPVCITRCSNNYGPYQFPEKLIPRMVYRSLRKKSLPVYGNGLQVRSWLHVLDHCRAIEQVVLQGKNGEIYNIGSEDSLANIELVRKIVQLTGGKEEQIASVTDRPAHDQAYFMDCSKIKKELGWAPQVPFEQGMEETIRWYMKNVDWMEEAVARVE